MELVFKFLNRVRKFYRNKPYLKKSFHFLITALLGIGCLSSQTSAQAIENGSVAIGEPVIGFFYEGDSWISCSGAILEPRIVATAHHCIPNAGGDSDFYLKRKMIVSEPGKVITFEPGNQARVVEIITKKEKWSLGVCANGFCDDLDDIAFLILDRDYPVPENLKIASLEDVQRFRTIAAPVVTYGFGLISYGKTASGTPYKLNANLQPPNPGGYGVNAFNIFVKDSQNVCGGDSGGPTYVLEGTDIYYLGPTSGTRRPSCIQKPMIDSGFFGGTFLAAKVGLYLEAKEKVSQIKVAADKAAAELKAKQEAAAKAALDAKVAADLASAAAIAAAIELGISIEKSNKTEIQAKLEDSKTRLLQAQGKFAAATSEEARKIYASAIESWNAAIRAYQSKLNEIELSIENLEAAKVAKAAADKAAAELKAKQEAEAKAAAELKAKQDAEAKAAADKAAQAKAQSELVAANAALADSQKVNRELQTQLSAVEAQFKLLSDSVSVIQGQVSQLNSKLIAALAGQNAANAKLKKICSAKPKPKGC